MVAICIEAKMRADGTGMVINENQKESRVKDGAPKETCISIK